MKSKFSILLKQLAVSLQIIMHWEKYFRKFIVCFNKSINFAFFNSNLNEFEQNN